MYTRSFIAVAALTTALAFAAQAQTTSDPEIGTWKLNLAKSKFTPGPGPKAQLRTLESTPGGIRERIHEQGAEGRTTNTDTTFRYDGKPYAFAGLPGVDTISIRRPHKLTAVFRSEARRSDRGPWTATLSKDHNTLTVSLSIAPGGHPQHLIEVLDRQ